MHKVITKGLGLFYLYAPALVSLPVLALLPTKATARVLVIISYQLAVPVHFSRRRFVYVFQDGNMPGIPAKSRAG